MRVIKFLIYILVFLVPLGQFSALPIGSGEVGIYFTEIFLAFVILVSLVYLLLKKSLEIPAPFGWVIVFVMIGFLSLINGSRYLGLGEATVSALYLLRFILYVLLSFVIYNLYKISESGDRFLKNLLKFFIFTGIVLSVLGFIQLQILPDFTRLDPSLGWDPHQNRLTSTFFDPNFVGAYLVGIITVVLSFLAVKEPPFSKKFLITSFIICFSALIFTFSRSAYLMFAVVILVIGILRSRKLLAVSLIAFLLATFMVPRVQTRIAGGVDPDDSARKRFISWGNTLEIAKEHPALGVGFNSFRYAQARYGFFDPESPLGGRAGAGSDSSTLFVLATTGVLGTASFLLFFFDLFIRSFRSFRKKVDHFTRGISLSLVGLIPALFVESNFINSLFYPWIMILLWSLVGVFVSSVRQKND